MNCNPILSSCFKLTLCILWLLTTSICFSQNRVYNVDSSFSFIPSENWINYSDSSGLIFAQVKHSSYDKYQENIQIHKYSANGLDLHTCWNNDILKAFPKSFDNFKIVSMWDTKINGYKAKWMEYTCDDIGMKFKDIVYIIVEKNTIYFIMCLSLDDAFEATEKDFRNMVDSFEIK